MGEIKLKDVFKVLWKEIQVSCLVGFSLSAVNFVRLYYLEKVDLPIVITVTITLFFTVIIAVSYTHLDVYKRQTTACSNCSCLSLRP